MFRGAKGVLEARSNAPRPAQLLCAAPAFAGRPFTPEELLATRRLDDPQASPDGKQVAFTVRQKSLELNAT